MMELKNIVCEWVIARLMADETVARLTNGEVFAFRSKRPVQGAFVALSDYVTDFERTKDGLFPAKFSLTANCVAASLTEADELAEAVGVALADESIPGTDASLNLFSMVTDVDNEDFCHKLNFLIEL